MNGIRIENNKIIIDLDQYDCNISTHTEPDELENLYDVHTVSFWHKTQSADHILSMIRHRSEDDENSLVAQLKKSASKQSVQPSVRSIRDFLRDNDKNG